VRVTLVKEIRIFPLAAVLLFTVAALGRSQQPPAARVVDLKASDGAILKASFSGN
jgi:hypothetical protein